MVMHCFVPNCDHKKKKHCVSCHFFRFPTDPDRLQRWTISSW